MDVVSAATDLRELLVAHDNTSQQIQALDEYVLSTSQRQFLSTMEGNRGESLHVALRLSISEGIQTMYTRYQDRKWNQVQEKARSIASALRDTEDDHVMLSPLSPGGSTKLDKAAGMWSSAFCVKKTLGMKRTRDYTPVYWDKYFERMHDIKCGENTFRVYECGTEGPVLLFLHGGGFSALSWALLCGAMSGYVTCRCAAIDLRGHGDSESTDDSDLCAEIMSSDVGDVVKELYGDEPPPIVLIGHSMGGAIAVHTAQRELIPSLAGLVVIDVVEGTALEALSSMQAFLRGRPKAFKSMEHAIEWAVRSGQIRNLESAKVSMVGQVKRLDTNETASSILEHQHTASSPPPSKTTDTITEEEEEEEEGTDNSPSSSTQTQNNTQNTQTRDNQNNELPAAQFTWRIELSKTEPFWRGWFQGLSERFLSCTIPKLLLLAGVDRLDKDLTIGQMQGKFQMHVLPKSGHAVHEDVPEQVADVLCMFLLRNKLTVATANYQRPFPGC